MVIGFFLSPSYYWVFQSISDIVLKGTVDLFLIHYSFDCSEVSQTTAFRLLLVISLLTLDVSIYVFTQPNSLWKTSVPKY